jgi:hypothetical protein
MNMVRQETDCIGREWESMQDINPGMAEQAPGKVTGEDGLSMVGNEREKICAAGNP